MPESAELILADEAATAALGHRLGWAILKARPGQLVVWLRGGLGAGKTCLVRGLLGSLGHGGRVPSPTYTLVEPYALAGYRVLHLDLYRLATPGDVTDLALREEVGPGTLLFVEWPEQGAGNLPAPDLEIGLELAGVGRRACLGARSGPGQDLLAALAGDPG